MYEIFIAALIAAFVTLIASAYFYENKIQKTEAFYRDKTVMSKKDYADMIKLSEKTGYDKGYVDGGLDAKKGFAEMFRNYPTS